MAATTRSDHPNLVAIGVVLVIMVGAVGWFRLGPYGMSRAEAEAEVERLAGVDAEYFYLGEEADGHRLARIWLHPDEDGSMIFEYGRCLDNDEGGCNRPLNVSSRPNKDRTGALLEEDCVGVEQVLGEGQIVVVGESTVEITYWDVVPDGYMTNVERSRAMLSQLRAVGQPAAAMCPHSTP